jgi:hypothetical protein
VAGIKTASPISATAAAPSSTRICKTLDLEAARSLYEWPKIILEDVDLASVHVAVT